MLGRAINYLLKDSTAVTDLVGTKIYPVVIPEETLAPVITWRISSNPEYTKSSTPFDESNARILIFSQDYDNAVDIFLAVRPVLENVRGIYNGVQLSSGRITNYSEDYDRESDLYLYEINIIFKHK